MQQQALRDLDRAFRNWWNGSHRKPTRRKAGQNEGFYIRDVSAGKLNRNWGEVQVAKCGWVRFRLTRSWAEIDTYPSARVTLDRPNRWHVSFTAPQPSIAHEPTGALIGLDMEIASSVTTFDRTGLHMPKLLSPREALRKRRLQRRLARQKKGSNGGQERSSEKRLELSNIVSVLVPQGKDLRTKLVYLK